MPGNFSQFGVRERGYSDIVSPTAPVASAPDSSGAAIAQGIAALAGVGLDLYKMNKEEEASQAMSAQREEFESKLLTARDMAVQQGADSLAFNNFLTKSFDESTLDFDTKAKMLKDFQGTVLGKVFTEKSVQEQVEEANQLEAGKAGWISFDASPEQVAAETAAFMSNKRAQEAIAESSRAANSVIANINATQAQREEAKFVLRENQKKALVNLSSSGRHTQRNIINETVAKLDAGATLKDVQAELKAKRSDLKALVASSTMDVTDREFVDRLANPLYELYDIALASTDSATLQQELDYQIAIIKKTEELALLQDERVAEASAFISVMAGSAGGNLLVEQVASEIIVKNSNQEGRGADLVSETEEDAKNATQYFDVITQAITDRDRVDYKGDLRIDPSDLQTQVKKVLQGGGRYISEDDSPKSLQPILTFLANPEVADYMGDPQNSSLFTPEVNQRFKDALESNAVNVVYPQLADALSGVIAVDTPVTTSRSGRSTVTTGGADTRRSPSRGQGGRALPSAVVSPEELEIGVVGGNVRFIATTPSARGAAEKLNKSEGLVYTTSLYLRSMATATGRSLEEVLEDQKPFMWPERYATNQPTTPEKETVEQQPSQDFSMYEGQLMQDEEGNRFLIVDGQPVAQN